MQCGNGDYQNNKRIIFYNVTRDPGNWSPDVIQYQSYHAKLCDFFISTIMAYDRYPWLGFLHCSIEILTSMYP